MAFPDVSQILRGDALLAEDKVWRELIHEKKHLADLLQYIPFKGVLEIGCGTGLYAKILKETWKPPVYYVGVDSNPEAIIMASERNPHTEFVLGDFREVVPKRFDLVCAHAFLKHFNIAEWPDLFLKFLSLGRFAQFDMQTAVETFNDGSQSFGNNLWVSETLFAELLAKARHVIKYSEVAWQSGDRKATIYITEETR